MRIRIKNLHIAANPSRPRYSVLVETIDGAMVWCVDCASDSEEITLALTKRFYPRRKVLLWDHPQHYSNQ